MGKRIKRLLNLLKEIRIDGILVTDLSNLRYLTGFTGSNGTCIITHNDLYLLTDSRYEQQSREEAKEFKIFIGKDLIEIISNNNLFDNLKKIGFESHHTTYSQYKKIIDNFRNINFIPLENHIEKNASIKDNEEIENIKEAAHISDLTLEYITNLVKPGISENEIAAEISYFSKKQGSEKDAFPPIVASGKRSSLPHGAPTDKLIEDGDMVILDFGATVNGYKSDLTRTVFVNSPTEELKKIYNIVLKAQSMAVEKAKPGVKCSTLDRIARTYICKKRYGDYFGHSLGHGIGLGTHSYPKISGGTPNRLKKGMTITIEPGIYIPGLGGVRIEDDILITANGCTFLTNSSREMTVL